MFVNLSRIIKYGLQDFLRNGLLSISTIVIMILAVIVFEGLIIFNHVSEKAITSLEDKIDISVYFKEGISEDSILDLKRALEGLSEVKNVEYISKEKALEDFKRSFEKDETVSEALAELDVNPLLPSVNIKANDPNNYKIIAGYLDKPSLQSLVEKVSYAQNQIVIDRLTKIIDTSKKGGIILTAFLTFLAILVTFNTIRLAIYSNSEQISIMRLVGASNSFIRGPYLIEAIVYGIVAAILGFIIWIPVLNIGSPYISNFIPQINLADYLSSNFFSLLGYQILFGIFLGVISSVVAIRKYLKI